jgi:hypothetical protein
LHQARLAPNPVIELNLSRVNQTQSNTCWLHCEGSPELLFTENETNARRLFGIANVTRFVKDGINDHVVHGVKKRRISTGTAAKAVADFRLQLSV